MSTLNSCTLADLKRLGDISPRLARMAGRILVVTYDDFIEILYADIDDCIVELERNRELRQDKREDRLSVEILNMLHAMGYETSHEQKSGGHVDLTVKHQRGFEWLGEAKVHNSYDYLLMGFRQLCTRYSTGSPKSKCGGILAYVYNVDVAAVIKEWRARLREESLPGFEEWDCQARRGLSFYSRHKHDLSGLPYTVRHMAVMLNHSPIDRPQKKL